VWAYVNRFAEFNNYVNSPIANYNGKLFNLPFNMNTFYQIWGVVSPDEAKAKIAEQVRESGITEPQNLEEQAIALVGQDVFAVLVKGYTEKQWGRECKNLPPFIIKRLPLRFTYDNNYFDDPCQGIPIDGYTKMIQNMLSNIEVYLNTDYLLHKKDLSALADKVVYSGQIDAYFDYCYGALEYRSVYFETKTLNTSNYQGVAVMNYTDCKTPFTRVIEHRHFESCERPKTVISFEYPSEWKCEGEPHYPVNNEKNTALYLRYKLLAEKQANVFFGGRLGEYKYYDMDMVIASALETVSGMICESNN